MQVAEILSDIISLRACVSPLLTLNGDKLPGRDEASRPKR